MGRSGSPAAVASNSCPRCESQLATNAICWSAARRATIGADATCGALATGTTAGGRNSMKSASEAARAVIAAATPRQIVSLRCNLYTLRGAEAPALACSMRAQSPAGGDTGSTSSSIGPSRPSQRSTSARKFGSVAASRRARVRSSPSRMPSAYSAASEGRSSGKVRSSVIGRDTRAAAAGRGGPSFSWFRAARLRVRQAPDRWRRLGTPTGSPGVRGLRVP